MARRRQSDAASSPLLHRTLTPPGVFLIRMLIFLTLVAFLAAILHKQLIASFMNNPGLNGLIVGVLCLGILYAFRQVARLYPEIRWVNAFRIADPGLAISHQPILLAPMAALLRDRTGVLSLSTVSMRPWRRFGATSSSFAAQECTDSSTTGCKRSCPVWARPIRLPSRWSWRRSRWVAIGWRTKW